MKRITSFRKDLEAKKAVKIIAGIDNFDMDRVKSVVIAADRAGASAVDVCANEEIIKMAKETPSLPVFVSLLPHAARLNTIVAATKAESNFFLLIIIPPIKLYYIFHAHSFSFSDNDYFLIWSASYFAK